MHQWWGWQIILFSIRVCDKLYVYMKSELELYLTIMCIHLICNICLTTLDRWCLYIEPLSRTLDAKKKFLKENWFKTDKWWRTLKWLYVAFYWPDFCEESYLFWHDIITTKHNKSENSSQSFTGSLWLSVTLVILVLVVTNKFTKNIFIEILTNS